MEILEPYAQTTGLIGVIIVLIAYGMVTTGKWRAAQYRYPITNFIGTAMIAFSLVYAWNWPSFIMQIFMMSISVLGVVRIAKAGKAGIHTQAAATVEIGMPNIPPEETV